MTESINEKLFDVLLNEAFARYGDEINADLPPAEELNKKYPLSKKEFSSVLRYQRRFEKEKKYGRPLSAVYLRRVVAAVLIVVSVFFAAIMMNAEVRTAVRNAIVLVFDKFVEITPPTPTDNSKSMSVYDFDVLPNVPEGYELTESIEKGSLRSYCFADGDGKELYVNLFSAGVSVGIDNEHSVIEKIEIDGNEAYLQVDLSEEPRFVSVIVIKENIVLMVTGYENEETMTRIAEAIIKNKGKRQGDVSAY